MISELPKWTCLGLGCWDGKVLVVSSLYFFRSMSSISKYTINHPFWLTKMLEFRNLAFCMCPVIDSKKFDSLVPSSIFSISYMNCKFAWKLSFNKRKIFSRYWLRFSSSFFFPQYFSLFLLSFFPLFLDIQTNACYYFPTLCLF